MSVRPHARLAIVRSGVGGIGELPLRGRKSDMTRQDDAGKTRTDPRPDERDPQKPTLAPPIEREHETQEGAIEEDEKAPEQREEEHR